jgi:hypothetical protein
MKLVIEMEIGTSAVRTYANALNPIDSFPRVASMRHALPRVATMRHLLE